MEILSLIIGRREWALVQNLIEEERVMIEEIRKLQQTQEALKSKDDRSMEVARKRSSESRRRNR